jgi:hypothetical protein
VRRGITRPPPAPAVRYIVHAPRLPGRNCFCVGGGGGTCGFPGSKGTRFRHGGETPAVIRPARRCRRTPVTCRPDLPPLAREVEAWARRRKQGRGWIEKGGLEEGLGGKRGTRRRGSRPRRASLFFLSFSRSHFTPPPQYNESRVIGFIYPSIFSSSLIISALINILLILLIQSMISHRIQNL